MKKVKKGFTLTELIIVIVIIGILAAVLIPSLSSYIKKAKISADVALVKNLNSFLATTEIEDGKNKTVSGALSDAFEAGYTIEKITPTSSGDILWDEVNDRFLLVDDNEFVYGEDASKEVFKDTKYKLWKIVSEINESTTTYSYYLSGTEVTGDITVSTGIDVGRNTNITSITYNNNEKKTVVIKTNGGKLNINASNDTINHYGWLKELNVTAVSNNDCYHEYGYAGVITKFDSGKFVTHEGSKLHMSQQEVETLLTKQNVTADLTNALFGEHYYKNSICEICGEGIVPIKKNGLVNGYYYKDDELFTGSENGCEFYTGMLVINYDSKRYINKSSTSIIVEERVYNYIIPTSEYLTDRIIIKDNNNTYDAPSTINITDNTGKNYVIKSVQAKAPFNGLLNKTGWTKDDVLANLMNEGGKALIKDGYKIEDGNKLTSYINETEGPDDYDIFIPYLSEDSELVKNYLSLVGCATIQEYYDKYQNDTLMITFANYLKLLYGKGYTLTNDNGTIKYNKTFGNNYESDLYDDFYISVIADPSTGLPLIKYVNKDGTYMTALTKNVNGKLTFCDYVLDADDKTHCTNENYLTGLKFYIDEEYYVSISNNVVLLHRGSITGTEVCKFEIDNQNNVIKTFINGSETDTNGVPFTMPSSGNVTLDNGKVSLTGSFNVEGVSIPTSAFIGLAGMKNSSTLMFEIELIELIIKAAYLDNLSVLCNGENQEYSFDDIPTSVFVKNDSTFTAKFGTMYSKASLVVLTNNIFNGVDYAGTSYEIILEVTK